MHRATSKIANASYVLHGKFKSDECVKQNNETEGGTSIVAYVSYVLHGKFKSCECTTQQKIERRGVADVKIS